MRRSLTAALLALALAPSAASAAPQLPDLIADAPVQHGSPEVFDDGQGARLLVRFDGYLHNVGPGLIEVRGTARDGDQMATVRQRAWDPAVPGLVELPQAGPLAMQYETNDGHAHWHLAGASRYTLVDDATGALVAPAEKVGFCFVDFQRTTNPNPTPAYPEDSPTACGDDDPLATEAIMGISAGWRDIYAWNLWFQWVDVSDTQPGVYRLRAEVDPDDALVEAAEDNQTAAAPDPTVIAGYRALARDAGFVAPGSAALIGLGAASFDDDAVPGERRFRIESAPAHGTLDVAAGADVDGDAVTYTPAAGYEGPDSFTFSARDASSPYPRSPAAAAVTLQVGEAPAPSVAISGAPATMLAGTSVQLSAHVTNAPQGVSWSADHGTVTADGLYAAPASVASPVTASVTAAATAASAASTVQIRIDPAPAPRSAPTVTTAPPTRQRSALSSLRLRRSGTALIVGTRSRRSGTLRIHAWQGTRRLRGCKLRAPARRSLVCKTRLRKRTLRGVRVTATLRVRGKRVALRRTARRP